MAKASSRNLALLMTCCLFSVSCNDDLLHNDLDMNADYPINLSGNIDQENVTRASDNGFVSGDRMGIYIVDYDNGNPGNLLTTGNRASNVLFTFDGDSYKWSAPTEIYWRDAQTAIDVYGYYPGVNYIDNPAEYIFEVNWKQNAAPQEGEISNYEASDLLWGKATGVKPTTDEIVIDYQHQLAGVYVTLLKGDGISDVEWEKFDKIVSVDNTVRACKFNIQTAEITLNGTADRSIMMLSQSADRYRAVVVPQSVAAGQSLISITIDGKSYSHKLTEAMKYQGGKMHNFTITINKSASTGDYVLSFADKGISEWVNDETSHSFSQNQYVIINCSEPGKLKDSIAAGYDYKEMKNLKVKGILNHEDFWFMRDEMVSLSHVNLSDVTVKNAWMYHDYNIDRPVYADDAIPGFAFYGNKTLRSITLPNSVSRIGENAFREMQLMNSTLIIPESVSRIDEGAFSYNESNTLTLVLPQSLDTLMRFGHCNWKCEFNLSDNIRELGGIEECPNFYGTFHLPSKLKQWPSISKLGSEGSFVGEVEIPQGITSINGFDVSFKKRPDVTLPSGIKRIDNMRIAYNSFVFNDDLEEVGNGCFYCASLPFQITLPSQLRKVEDRGFWNCGLEGELVIPENCLDIGSSAFALNNLTKITLPSRMEVIPKEVFQGNSYTTVTIPRFVNYIGDNAFSCSYLQSVVCLAETPPIVLEGDPFGDVAKDKCVLEVPEESVGLYRNTPVWNTFKNITPHRELAFNVPSITCMEKGTTQTGIVRSEGAWEVTECPSWVTVIPSSSDDKKTEVTIKVSVNSAETREGKIVFKLKNNDYTTFTDVKQVAADVKEEQTFTLQSASKGNKAIPLFLVGDGYDAEDIASGLYLNDMNEQMEHIFSIEPMKSYRDYFTVSTAIACSPESGIDGLRKFQSDNWSVREDDLVLQYAQQYGVGIKGNEGNSAILVLRNSNSTGSNSTTLYDNSHRGLSISWMAKSNDVYPFDQKGFVLREMVGTGFGKLGPEHVNHFTFIKSCTCNCCSMMNQYERYRSLGWWQNVSVSSKLSELPWYHLIFDEKYAQYVDVFEGAVNHSRGAFRSENVSVMGDLYIPYFNAISREILVRRIMEASGETFDFETWKQNDKIEIPD